MRVGIYCRISTKGKKQDTDNQLRQLKDFAAKQGWTVARIYEDQASGRKGERDREALKQVFTDAAKRRWDCLLFWSLDRLTREGTFATLKYLNRLSDLGISYRSYTEEYLNTGGVFGDVIVSLLSSLARQEAIRMSERTIAGLEKARLQGRVGGRPRVPVKQEQVLLMYEAGKSLTVIARELGIGKSTAHRLVTQLRPATNPTAAIPVANGSGVDGVQPPRPRTPLVWRLTATAAHTANRRCRRASA